MKCGQPATHRVVWGMDVLYQCGAHAHQLEVLGNAMGYRPVIDLYIGAETCSQEVGGQSTIEREMGVTP